MRATCLGSESWLAIWVMFASIYSNQLRAVSTLSGDGVRGLLHAAALLRELRPKDAWGQVQVRVREANAGR